MLVKGIVVLALIVIILSLGSSLFYLVKDQGQTTRVVKKLTWRIGLSLGLFILLFVLFATGLITPHSI